MKLNIIITGSTGMVGEGILLECLSNKEIESVLIVNRRPLGMTHPNLKEIITPYFLNLENIKEELKGYDACFYCAGVSSIGMSEADYKRITYDTTLNFANVVAKLNPNMVFTYVSGAMTDSTEKGKSMWARVKGKTENDLMKLPFKRAYNFRPGFMKAVEGQKNLLKFYKYVAWMYPIAKRIIPNQVSTLNVVGKAMINCVTQGYEKQILEIKDINYLGNRY
jgi:hypothetical protein